GQEPAHLKRSARLRSAWQQMLAVGVVAQIQRLHAGELAADLPGTVMPVRLQLGPANARPGDVLGQEARRCRIECERDEPVDRRLIGMHRPPQGARRAVGAELRGSGGLRHEAAVAETGVIQLVEGWSTERGAPGRREALALAELASDPEVLGDMVSEL